MTPTKEERDALRARGPLVPSGKCHYCGYKVPPKAHWCSGDCAKDFAAETAQNEAMKGSNGSV